MVGETESTGESSFGVRDGMRLRRLFRLAALLIFAGILATGVLFLPDDIQFLAEARPMQGKVISVDTRRQGIFSYDVARVQIQMQDSILHYPIEVNLFDRVTLGEDVELLYNPKIAPSLRFDTPFGRYQALGVFVLTAVGVTAALLLRIVVGTVMGLFQRG